MNAEEFMLKQKPVLNRFEQGDTIQRLRQRARCADGFAISIQASHTHYCLPREDGLDYYTNVELGYPSAADDLIAKYAETKDALTDTVYAYVPIEIVNELVAKHGGIVDA